MDKQTAQRIARKEVDREYGGHPLFSFCYCEGSRSVADFLETILTYRLIGDNAEADYWQGELRTLVPQFTDN